MKSVVFLAILVFVPFTLVYGDFLEDEYGIEDSWRPAFENPVETGFKDAHGKALGIKNFTPGRDHSLNHVYAWLSIRASINDEVEKAYKAKQGVSTIKKDLNARLRPFFGSHARTSHVQIYVRTHTCAHIQFKVVTHRTRTFYKFTFFFHNFSTMV